MPQHSRVLVSANPGSGKTEDLSNQVCSLLENGVSSENILCLTFTNKARDEMERRIIRKIEGNNAKIPDIHTFHSLSQSIIIQKITSGELVPERYMRYQILKSLEQRQIMNYDGGVLLKDFPAIVNVGQIVNAIKFLKSYAILPDQLNAGELAKSVKSEYSKGNGVNGYSVEEMEALCSGFVNIFSDYESSKLPSQLDYNDMLINALKMAKAHFNKYEYVFVDEVQDMSETEYELVKSVGKNIYAVGDIKQAIFGFQGGNVRAFREMELNSEYEKRVIDGTRRLPHNVMEYCRNFYKAHEQDDASPELDHFKSINERNGNVALTRLKDKTDMAESIAGIINNKNAGETIGIIVRTNEQANDLSESLMFKNIPHQKISGTKGERPWREEIAKFVCGVFGTSDNIIEMIYSAYSQLPIYDAIKISESMRFERDLRKILPEVIINLRETYGRKKTDIRKLFQDYMLPYSLHMGEGAYEAAKDIYESLPFFLGRFGTSEEYTIDALRKYILQENSRDSVDEVSQRICIITVHKAKGLEFDHVIYVPKYNEKKNSSAIDMIVDSILESKNLSYTKAERIKEENRIDFVAITRTKNSLDIVVEKKSSPRYEIEPSKIIDYINKNIRNEFVSLKEISDREKKRSDFNPWLKDYLKRKMEKLNNLSFTMLGRVDNLEQFVEAYVLGIQARSTALVFGSNVHSYIEDYIKEHNSPPILEDEKLNMTWANFMSYDKYIKDTQKGTWIGSEMKFKQKVNDVFPEIKTSVTIEGRIDGLYRYMDGNVEKIVIVDFKTSKKPNRDYVNQLSLYAKLYSLQENVRMEVIESEIAYLSLREGKVNLNKIDKKWERVNHIIETRALEEVKKTVSKFVNYKLSIDSLVRDIVAVRNPESTVFVEFQKILKMEMENS